MNTSVVLNRAADLIWEHGWTRGPAGWPGFDKHAGRLCIEGALAAALGTEADGPGRLVLVAHPAHAALRDYLGSTHLWHWNDTVPTEAVDVVQVLRAVALIVAAREQVSA